MKTKSWPQKYTLCAHKKKNLFAKCKRKNMLFNSLSESKSIQWLKDFPVITVLLFFNVTFSILALNTPTIGYKSTIILLIVNPLVLFVTFVRCIHRIRQIHVAVSYGFNSRWGLLIHSVQAFPTLKLLERKLPFANIFESLQSIKALSTIFFVLPQ